MGGRPALLGLNASRTSSSIADIGVYTFSQSTSFWQEVTPLARCFQAVGVFSKRCILTAAAAVRYGPRPAHKIVKYQLRRHSVLVKCRDGRCDTMMYFPDHAEPDSTSNM